MRVSRSSKPRAVGVAWPRDRKPIWVTKNTAAARVATQRIQRYLGTFMAERTSILSSPPKPLQGIEGLGLVADLEIEALALEGTGVADDGHGLPRPDHVADRGQELRAVAVKRVVGHAVVDDEEVAVALEVIGVDDLAGVNGQDERLVFGRRDLDPLVHDDRFEVGVLLEPERCDDPAVEGPRQPAFPLVEGDPGGRQDPFL